MSISKITGFKVCNVCDCVIQTSRYYEYKDQHFHPQKECTKKIDDPMVKKNMELKTVKSHTFPVKRK